ncbi:MAG: hypothetical protein JXB10_09875 [Pirellulales bacterium]|nr:hypothetical protein [Pirellulales bacterium]
MKTFGKLTAMLGLVCLTGCFNLAPPNWCHPGTAPVQQDRAVRFDPYPENEIGPATGTRPRDFAVPLAEPARARWQLKNLGR